MLMRTLLLLLFALAVPASAQTLDKIKKTGTLTLGYVDNAAPFAFLDDKSEPQGYSVDLCRAVAKDIATQVGRKDLKTQWVKLTLQNRMQAVQKRRVDIECGTATWTLTRQRLVDFSLITF